MAFKHFFRIRYKAKQNIFLGIIDRYGDYDKDKNTNTGNNKSGNSNTDNGENDVASNYDCNDDTHNKITSSTLNQKMQLQ